MLTGMGGGESSAVKMVKVDDGGSHKIFSSAAPNYLGKKGERAKEQWQRGKRNKEKKMRTAKP
jgi:hypothetical protein